MTTYSVAEAAAVLGWPERQVNDAVEAGRIPAVVSLFDTRHPSALLARRVVRLDQGSVDELAAIHAADNVTALDDREA